MCHALVRGYIVAVCLIYGSGRLFASTRGEGIGSSAQVANYVSDDEPSAYALLWSYFSSLANASLAGLQHD